MLQLLKLVEQRRLCFGNNAQASKPLRGLIADTDWWLPSIQLFILRVGREKSPNWAFQSVFSLPRNKASVNDLFSRLEMPLALE